ncbi:hypothetical protein BHM03_00018543 [Ensete ventricosum]|nr:hypothetical protein BHM03_00018543 [Ensete ventricosum]
MGRMLLQHRALLLAPNVVVVPQRSLLLLQCLAASGIAFAGFSSPLMAPHAVNRAASHPSSIAPSVGQRTGFPDCHYQGQVGFRHGLADPW